MGCVSHTGSESSQNSAHSGCQYLFIEWIKVLVSGSFPAQESQFLLVYLWSLLPSIQVPSWDDPNLFWQAPPLPSYDLFAFIALYTSLTLDKLDLWVGGSWLYEGDLLLAARTYVHKGCQAVPYDSVRIRESWVDQRDIPHVFWPQVENEQCVLKTDLKTRCGGGTVSARGTATLFSQRACTAAFLERSINESTFR
jgi:hypothetical protein